MEKEKNIFLAGIGWNSAGIVFRLLRFVYLIVFARMLGIDDFGQYILFFSIIEAVSKVSTLGLEYGSIKLLQSQLAVNPTFNVYYSIFRVSGVALCLTLLFAFGAMLVGYMLFDKSPYLQSFIQFCWVIPPLAMVNFLSIVSRSTLSMRYENVFRNGVETSCIFLFGFVFLSWDSKVSSLSYAHIAASLVTCVLYGAVFFRSLQRNDSFKIPWKHLFNESYIMGMIAFVNYTRIRADYFLLGKFLSFAQLAIYSMAVQIIGLIAKINSVVVPIAGPLIHSIYIEGNQNKLQQNLYQMLRFSVHAIFLGGIILFFFYQDILMLYGKSFVLDRNIFSILLLAQMVFVFFGIPEQFLLFTKHQKRLLLLSTGLISLMAGSFFVFVPRFGLYGAVWSILVVYVVYGAGVSMALTKKLSLCIVDRFVMRDVLFFFFLFLVVATMQSKYNVNRFVICGGYLVLYALYISKVQAKQPFLGKNN